MSERCLVFYSATRDDPGHRRERFCSAVVIDFGDNPASGPLSNDWKIREALEEHRPGMSRYVVNGMIRLCHNYAHELIINDEPMMLEDVPVIHLDTTL